MTDRLYETDHPYETDPSDPLGGTRPPQHRNDSPKSAGYSRGESAWPVQQVPQSSIDATRYDVFQSAVLQSGILPATIESISNGPLRVWICGCGTGVWLYPMARLILDAVQTIQARLPSIRLNPDAFPARIFATDNNQQTIETVVAGRYSDDTLREELGERFGRRDRWFVRKFSGWAPHLELQQTIVPVHHDPLRDPTFPNLDLIINLNDFHRVDDAVVRSYLSTFSSGLKSDGFYIDLHNASIADQWFPTSGHQNVWHSPQRSSRMSPGGRASDAVRYASPSPQAPLGMSQTPLGVPQTPHPPSSVQREPLTVVPRDGEAASDPDGVDRTDRRETESELLRASIFKVPQTRRPDHWSHDAASGNQSDQIRKQQIRDVQDQLEFSQRRLIGLREELSAIDRERLQRWRQWEQSELDLRAIAETVTGVYLFCDPDLMVRRVIGCLERPTPQDPRDGTQSGDATPSLTPMIKQPLADCLKRYPLDETAITRLFAAVRSGRDHDIQGNDGLSISVRDCNRGILIVLRR